ncbi:hypothetical protein CBR_g33958 [Chara braunii]|uniref:Uncharacterized protein n=1 Tax=Chara braunii TaxID=69332 RepID=A0A388LHG2_CHABU|nr:hypothetical protein CBR_g33958 [Chara braunii]|eukprot:GBG81780.1 hypothetical protein CBR_g33958 [Chara braunii]
MRREAKTKGVSVPKLESGKWDWVETLDDNDLEYLSSLPFSIRIPSHNALIVHAGMVPGVPLEEQDLSDLYKVRYLMRRGALQNDRLDGSERKEKKGKHKILLKNRRLEESTLGGKGVPICKAEHLREDKGADEGAGDVCVRERPTTPQASSCRTGYDVPRSIDRLCQADVNAAIQSLDSSQRGTSIRHGPRNCTRNGLADGTATGTGTKAGSPAEDRQCIHEKNTVGGFENDGMAREQVGGCCQRVPIADTYLDVGGENGAERNHSHHDQLGGEEEEGSDSATPEDTGSMGEEEEEDGTTTEEEERVAESGESGDSGESGEESTGSGEESTGSGEESIESEAERAERETEWRALENVSKGVVAESWAPLWNGPEHIFFGHDAAKKLQCCDRATGLDTACVYGHQLTACILPTIAELEAMGNAAAHKPETPLGGRLVSVPGLSQTAGGVSRGDGRKKGKGLRGGKKKYKKLKLRLRRVLRKIYNLLTRGWWNLKSVFFPGTSHATWKKMSGKEFELGSVAC